MAFAITAITTATIFASNPVFCANIGYCYNNILLFGPDSCSVTLSPIHGSIESASECWHACSNYKNFRVHRHHWPYCGKYPPQGGFKFSDYHVAGKKCYCQSTCHCLASSWTSLYSTEQRIIGFPDRSYFPNKSVNNKFPVQQPNNVYTSKEYMTPFCDSPLEMLCPAPLSDSPRKDTNLFDKSDANHAFIGVLVSTVIIMFAMLYIHKEDSKAFLRTVIFFLTQCSRPKREAK